MRKTNLLLLVFAVFILPMLSIVSADYDVLSIVEGNASGMLITSSWVQTSVNPEIGDNITYVSTFNITGLIELNVTNITFSLPDNSTTEVLGDYVLRIANNTQSPAVAFTNGSMDTVLFRIRVGDYLLDVGNGTTFNITYKLLRPITATKLATSKVGRAYTETWNITSSASNITIRNASLTVTPAYWHTRIGNPTSVQFNATTKGYSVNLTAIRTFSDLNLTSNLIEYGSGLGTLSIVYNGPTVDQSSGSSATDTSVTPSVISQPRTILLIILGIVLVVGVTVGIVLLVKKYGR